MRVARADYQALVTFLMLGLGGPCFGRSSPVQVEEYDIETSPYWQHIGLPKGSQLGTAYMVDLEGNDRKEILLTYCDDGRQYAKAFRKTSKGHVVSLGSQMVSECWIHAANFLSLRICQNKESSESTFRQDSVPGCRSSRLRKTDWSKYTYGLRLMNQIMRTRKWSGPLWAGAQ